jgi:serine protease Do
MRFQSVTLVASATVLCLALLVPALAASGDPQPTGWLGVMLGQPRGPAPVDLITAEPPRGAMVSAVVEDGPAERAGLRARDLIVAVDGNPIDGSATLVRVIGQRAPGSWIPLTVERRGQERDLRVKLDGRPADTSRLRPRRGWVGIQAIDLPPMLRSHFGAPAEAGVMVSFVEPGSPGEAAGFELGDVVYEVDGEPVASAAHLKARVTTAGVGNRAEFRLTRAGAEMVLETVVDKAPESPTPEELQRR